MPEVQEDEMKIEKCEKMMNRILAGDHSKEVLEHLAECASCRELTALDRMVSGGAGRIEVPESLDRAVLSYAAGRKRSAGKLFHFSAFMRHAAVPLAAAFMICFGLAFAFRMPQKSSAGTVVKNRIPQDELDSLASELMLISSRIDEVSVQLSRTAAYTSIEEQNGVF